MKVLWNVFSFIVCGNIEWLNNFPKTIEYINFMSKNFSFIHRSKFRHSYFLKEKIQNEDKISKHRYVNLRIIFEMMKNWKLPS